MHKSVKKILPVDIYEVVKRVGSLRLRLDGMHKTHGDNVLVRPILSMIGLVQHKLVKWLAELLRVRY